MGPGEHGMLHAGTDDAGIQGPMLAPGEDSIEPERVGTVEQVRTHALANFAMQGPNTELVAAGTLPRDENPVLVYLASLSEGSRRSMRGSLEIVAEFVSGGRVAATELAWWRLRYQHRGLSITRTKTPAKRC